MMILWLGKFLRVIINNVKKWKYYLWYIVYFRVFVGFYVRIFRIDCRRRFGYNGELERR